MCIVHYVHYYYHYYYYMRNACVLLWAVLADIGANSCGRSTLENPCEHYCIYNVCHRFSVARDQFYYFAIDCRQSLSHAGLVLFSAAIPTGLAL